MQTMCPRCLAFHETADYPGAETLCAKCWMKTPEERQQRTHERIDQLIAGVDWENCAPHARQSAALIHELINDRQEKLLLKWLNWLERLPKAKPQSDTAASSRLGWRE